MLAAKNATNTIPIVMLGASDPVGSGLVAELARLGGNVTGLSLLATELGGKRLELLKESLPKIQRVGILDTGTGGAFELQLKETESAAKARGSSNPAIQSAKCQRFGRCISTPTQRTNRRSLASDIPVDGR